MMKLIVLLALTGCCSYSWAMPKKSLEADNACCMCGPEITVTLIAQNVMQQPFFNFSVQVTTQQRQLIYIMKKAVDVDKRFGFTVTYTGSTLGYFLDTLNGVSADKVNKIYWNMQTQSGFTSGISSFVPTNGAVIRFNYSK